MARKPVKSKKPASKISKASPVKAKPAGKNAREQLLAAYSDTSEAVEHALFRTQDAEDVSGFWPSSLVLGMCYGKICSGLYVAAGPEQASKSSALAEILGQSLKANTVHIKHYDVERAMRSSYMGGIISYYSGIPWESLRGVKTAKGVAVHPRYRWLLEAQLEKVFTEIRRYLTALPDKIYVTETKTWRLVFDVGTKEFPVSKQHTELHARVAALYSLDNKMSDSKSKYYDVGDDPAFQVFYAIDSVKALTLRAIEDESKGFHQPGLMAKALSDHLPYVKDLLRSKHAVIFAINQMYTNPMAKFSDPVYETAGNALKLHSDSRCIMKPKAVEDMFVRSKGKSGVCEEPSVIGAGKDEYTFKSIKNIKNKFAPPYLIGSLRVWSSGPKRIPGIDPVYDTVAFLEMIGLAKLGMGKPDGLKASTLCVKMADSPLLEGYSKDVIPWLTFKAEILAECGMDTGAEPSELRVICRDILESGKAYELAVSKDSAGVNHLADDSDEE